MIADFKDSLVLYGCGIGISFFKHCSLNNSSNNFEIIKMHVTSIPVPLRWNFTGILASRYLKLSMIRLLARRKKYINT